MKFVEVKKVPAERNMYKNQRILEEFLNMNVKCVEVQFDASEWKGPRSCCASLYNSVKRFGYPIRVSLGEEHVYLINNTL